MNRLELLSSLSTESDKSCWKAALVTFLWLITDYVKIIYTTTTLSYLRRLKTILTFNLMLFTTTYYHTLNDPSWIVTHQSCFNFNERNDIWNLFTWIFKFNYVILVHFFLNMLDNLGPPLNKIYLSFEKWGLHAKTNFSKKQLVNYTD